MAPVEEVHLNLHKIPVILVVVVDEPVKHAHVAMIGESQVSYASCFALFHEEVEQAVIQESLLELFHAALPHTVHEVVIDVVDAQLLERVLIHFLGTIESPVFLVIVRHLGGNKILVTWVAA